MKLPVLQPSWSCSGKAWSVHSFELSSYYAKSDWPLTAAKQLNSASLSLSEVPIMGFSHLPGSQTAQTSRNSINLQPLYTSFNGDCTWPTRQEVISRRKKWPDECRDKKDRIKFISWESQRKTSWKGKVDCREQIWPSFTPLGPQVCLADTREHRPRKLEIREQQQL